MSTKKDEVTIFIKELVKPSSNPTDESKPKIFRVDDRLREANGNDYEPKIVSIGPIHYGKDRVKSMEKHKERFLKELLQGRDDRFIENLVAELSKIEKNARECYSGSLNLDKSKLGFLGILLLDGCFIIQLIRKYFFKNKDPIFESKTLIQIIHDLLLFENQLPFFVLDRLFDLTKTGNPDDNLPDLILFLVGDVVPWLDDSKLNSQFIPDHLLGLVYQCISTKTSLKLNSPWYRRLYPKHLLGLIYKLILIIIRYVFHLITLIVQLIMLLYRGKQKKPQAKGKKSPENHINSASELSEIGGIELKMSEDDNITFASKVLRIPPLEVSGETESLLRNLMAYEQLQLDDDHPKHVIDYVFFLHCLSRSNKDIEILRYSGIIKNYLGSDEKILKMFDQLGTNFMTSSQFTYSDVFERLNRHCVNRRNQQMASLYRVYFNSPWSIIKFAAATFLLMLAATQTFYAVLSYYNPKT